MNTIQVLEKVMNDNILKQNFIGVFPVDMLPKIYNVPCSLIVNLDPRRLPGSHWVALYFMKNNKCEYFDSYGRLPDSLILKYISQNANSYTYNNKCVQDFDTISCGHMCLYYLVWRCRGISFKDIVNSMLNDDFIAGFIDSL